MMITIDTIHAPSRAAAYAMAMDLSHVTEIEGYRVVPGSVKLTGSVMYEEERFVQIAYTLAEAPGESLPMPNRTKWIVEEDLQYL